MKLGNYAHISISVRQLQESEPFYELLGFRRIMHSEDPHPWSLMTDGRVNVHLFEALFPSPALHYFSSHMQDKVLELMRLNIHPKLQKSADGGRMQHEFFDPNELSIMLMHFDDASMPLPNGFSQSRLGTFGELAIDTGSVEESVGFYQKLDFRVVLRGSKPYPWAVLNDGTMTLSFHETQNFRSPALTYYAPDVESRLRTVRDAGIAAIRELHDDQRRTAGAVLTAPDGQLFFLLEGE